MQRCGLVYHLMAWQARWSSLAWDEVMGTAGPVFHASKMGFMYVALRVFTLEKKPESSLNST